jgi:hypothetical protein
VHNALMMLFLMMTGQAAAAAAAASHCRSPAFHQIHAHAINHVPEWLDLHWELSDCVCQRCIQLVVRPPLKQRLQPLLPAVQCLAQQQQQQQPA